MWFFNSFDISLSENAYEIYLWMLMKSCFCHIFCIFINLPTSLKNVWLLSNALATIFALKKSSCFTVFIVILTQIYIFTMIMSVCVFLCISRKNLDNQGKNHDFRTCYGRSTVIGKVVFSSYLCQYRYYNLC